MSSLPSNRWPRRAVLAGLAVLAVGCLAAFAFPPVRAAMQKWLGAADHAGQNHANGKSAAPVELVEDEQHHDGLRISREAIENLQLHPVAAEPAVRPRPLPPLPGHLNYDYDGLHAIRPRFGGELVELRQVQVPQPPYRRPLRVGDRVKPGEVLAVLWCRDLGEKKAALVDAMQNLRLSENKLARLRKLFSEASTSLAALNEAERQYTLDKNALRTAERTLRIWKLSDQEIDEIKKEANTLLEQGKERSAGEEVKMWARVEVKVPQYAGPDREYFVVEVNTNENFADPTQTPLFRLADLNRLLVWVHPPEEYVPMLRERLKQGDGALRWQVQIQAEPNQPPLDLPIAYLSTSIDPNSFTATLIGYLDNRDHKYLVGQFITATIFVPPSEDTVEVPTEAVNQYEMQNFVIVQHPERKDEFFLRRIVLVSNSGGKSLVRSKLTPADEELSKQEQARGHRPLEPLRPGERVITKGVVELTSEIDRLVTERDLERQPPAAGRKE